MTGSPKDIETSGLAAADIDAAVEWLVRLQGQAVSEQDWLAFDAWLTASPVHAQAYDAALAFDQRLELDVRTHGENQEAPADHLGATIVPFRRPTRRVWLWSTGGALAAAAVAGAIAWSSGSLLGTHETTYVTGVGERRTIALEDGSRVELNAASRMTVRFERGARRVKLDDAQAFFDVAKDARRPFLIQAGDTGVRVVGTQFDVRHRDGQVAVAVQRGVVEVRPKQASGKTPFRLTAGQGIAHVEGQADDAQVSTVAVEDVTGWRQGRLVYRDRPLSEIAGDLNRLFPRPVKLADEQAANMRLSGVLIVDGQDAMVDRLSNLLPVRTTTTDDAIVIRAR
ncbi:MAG: FecR domain-containing protein [Caulobacter sp.]|nr:FecR domain-containing protein [Caulobacter sp.]